MDYNLTTSINGLPYSGPYCNYLTIVWAKSFGSLYCYSASLAIEAHNSSLFDDPTAKITVKKIVRNFDSTGLKNEFEMPYVAFLPYQHIDGKIEVPLIDTTVCELLTVNLWSKSPKGGYDLQLKEAPAEISCVVNGQESILKFDWMMFRTPFLLIRPQLLSLSDGDKLTQTIVF